MTFVTGPRQRDRYYERYGFDQVSAPFGDVIDATAADAWIHSPFSSIGRIFGHFDRYAESTVANVLGEESAQPGGINELLDPDELNERYGELGLSFTAPMSRGTVEIMVRRKREETARRSVLSRGRGGIVQGTAQFFTGIAVSMADPINVASAFVPVVGPARQAILAHRLGRTGGRIATGLAEGAAGAALVEPVVLAAAALDQSEYGYMDSLLNITFGSVMGGGLHAGFGKVSDLLNGVQPHVREGALRAAVAQSAEGRPVDVEHVLATDPRFRGGEAAFDPLDPRYLPELNPGQRPPPGRAFELGPALGEGTGVRFVNYSRISAGDMRFIDDLAGELAETHSGHRAFTYNQDAPGQTVTGIKATTPRWFQALNEEAVGNRKARQEAQARAAKAGRPDDVKPGDMGAENIVTRDDVSSVIRKLKAREPLGRQEGELAEVLFATARDQREVRIREIMDYRAQRMAEAEAEIHAYAARALDDIDGRIDIGPDDEFAIRAADEAAAMSRTKFESVDPDAEDIEVELTFLNGELDALRALGEDVDALMQDEIRRARAVYAKEGIVLERSDVDPDTATVAAYKDAAVAAARCLIYHP